MGSDGTCKCGTEITQKFPTNLKAHMKGNHAANEEMLKKEAKKQKEKET